MQGKKIPCLIGAVILSSIALGHATAAAPDCDPVVGELISVEGTVQLQRAGGGSWQAAGVGAMLCDKDTVRTEANSRASVSLVNDAVFRLDQNTAVHLADIAPEPEEKSFVQLLVGAIQSFSRKPREVAIDTPYLNATIEGTEFVIRVAQNETELTVFEGTVRAANPQGAAAVTSGQMVVAQAGQAPRRRVVVRPRDAAQWSIYYPPVLAAMGGGQAPSDLPPAIAEAAGLAGQGNAAGALEAMDRVPATQQDARYHLYRASFLLAAGQVEGARGAIDRALQLDAGSGLAYAQRAVIDVAQNRNDEALANGRRAVELAPDSTAASIALSYALQATYQLGEARQTLEKAVAANPDDALARARLAELWMMIGYRDRARAEAEKAVELAPNMERAQVVLGFAALVEIRTTQAKDAFRKAIAIDSDDPMAHLGLGLAMIREGDLADGRKQIEAAVALDPESALLRSYLGKAYFEEKREEIDAQQLAMAKERDPNDPTAYLYDALRKQSENRPGEALQDLQKSIELNDNRAVYRGRLQLDEDRAARGASLANIYSDLGFTQMGLNEATKSLADDPTNASAHRFLSETYSGMPRREIARVSELFQAQMLQDVGMNPPQPSVGETHLTGPSAGGPANAGFNEFTALFERNRTQLNASAAYGTDDTWSAEGAISAAYDWFSISAGAFHYETEGFRPNAGAEHDIQSVFAQAALTQELNLQLEYRTRESEWGDLASDFDPALFFEDMTHTIDQDSARAGLRWSPTPNFDVLLSYIYSDRHADRSDVVFRFNGGCPVPDPVSSDCPVNELLIADTDGHQAETQLLYRGDRLRVTAGGAFVDADKVFETDVVLFRQDNPDTHFFGTPTIVPQDIVHSRGYAYGYINYPDAVTWTVGVSYDSYEEFTRDFTEINPKFGVQWQISDAVNLRAAAGQVVKPYIFNPRTLEPTQVAGFNQFFDEPNGTVSRQYGLGIDWKATDSLFMGVEGEVRDVDVPFFTGAADDVPAEEQRLDKTYRAFAYWTPHPQWALSLEFIYDHSDQDSGLLTSTSFALPEEVTTYTVPAGIRYFGPYGVFAGLGATYVRQEVERDPDVLAIVPTAAGDDSFFLVDAAIGWRLPNRAGTISLEAQNILDREFNYQDDTYRQLGDDPVQSTYPQGRKIMGRVTLKF